MSFVKQIVVCKLYPRGVVFITTAQLYSTMPELRFCACSNYAHSVSEICNDENLWQCSWLEMKFNAFRWSTLPQKQFIIIIIIIIIINRATTITITDTKLYVPVITSSTQYSVKLLQQIKSWFKLKTSWNKCQSKVSTQVQN